tara:strand:+ start:23893 stop:24612 length:720 start_codon:yes stop_codon:yes gene_type:complete
MDVPFVQYGVLVFCCLSLGYLSEKIVRLVGYKLTVTLGAPGIIAHEASHWIMAKVCGHRIIEARFFAPSSDGSLGYVNHAYKRGFTNYFTLPLISLAPLLLGPGVYYLATKLYYPGLILSLHINDGSRFKLANVTLCMHSVSEWLFTNFNVGKLAWVLLGISIVTFSVPSSIDIQNCRRHLAALLLAGGLLVHYGLKISFLDPYLSFILSFFLASVSLLSLSFIFAWCVRRFFSHKGFY